MMSLNLVLCKPGFSTGLAFTNELSQLEFANCLSIVKKAVFVNSQNIVEPEIVGPYGHSIEGQIISFLMQELKLSISELEILRARTTKVQRLVVITKMYVRLVDDFGEF
jgi:hypothetical protein